MATAKPLKLRIKNFMSIEDETIHLQNLGMVLINGINYDEMESNGSGKSTISNIALLYGLFGRTPHPRKPTLDKLIRRDAGKNSSIEVLLDNGWKIIRSRKPTSLKLIDKDGNDVSKPRSDSTQDDIERMIGFTYDECTRVHVFNKTSISSLFDDSETGRKRFVENIFGIGNYDNYCDNAKKLIKNAQLKIDALHDKRSIINIDSIQQDIVDIQSKRDSFDSEINDKINTLLSSIQKVEEEIKIIDEFDIKSAQESLTTNSDINGKISELNVIKSKLMIELSSTQAKVEQFNKVSAVNVDDELRVIDCNIKLKEDLDNACINKAKIESEINVLESQLNKLKNNAVTDVCPTCGQKIQGIEHIRNEINERSKVIEQLKPTLNEADADVRKKKSQIVQTRYTIDRLNEIKTIQQSNIITLYNDVKVKISKIDTMISELRSGLIDIKYDERYINALIQKKASLIKDVERHTASVSELKNSTNIYIDLTKKLIDKLEQARSQIKSIDDQIAELQTVIAYYEFWKNAFDKNGIKNLILRNAITAINTKVNNYLHLFGSSARVSFDISMINVAPEFDTSSTGENNRINISFMLACFDICSRMRNLGILVIDEALDGMDNDGAIKLIDILKSMSSRIGTIFLISHNPFVYDKLSTKFDKVITIEKRNGVSKIMNDK
jgi:DNA repair exonuclease SbcCD ATPase subunit